SRVSIGGHSRGRVVHVLADSADEAEEGCLVSGSLHQGPSSPLEQSDEEYGRGSRPAVMVHRRRKLMHLRHPCMARKSGRGGGRGLPGPGGPTRLASGRVSDSEWEAVTAMRSMKRLAEGAIEPR